MKYFYAFLLLVGHATSLGVHDWALLLGYMGEKSAIELFYQFFGHNFFNFQSFSKKIVGLFLGKANTPDSMYDWAFFYFGSTIGISRTQVIVPYFQNKML